MILNKLISIVGEKNVKKNESMKNHTTFRIGGRADYAVFPENEEQIFALLTLAKDENIPVTVLGNGSNVLVGDKGIRGIVIIISKNMSSAAVDGETVTAQSGILLSRLANVICDASLTGFEFASGIPGSLGGAIYMNAGAYGEEIAPLVKEVTYVDPSYGVKTIKGEDCSFGYRHTFFTDKDYIITKCTLSLKKGDKAQIKAKSDDLKERRTSKQPLDKASAGSTFKRPEGYFAGALIEQSGLKGFKIGDAEISPKHAGFVVNNKNATAQDVLGVIKHTQKAVKDNFGVTLEPEVKIIGEF